MFNTELHLTYTDIYTIAIWTMTIICIQRVYKDLIQKLFQLDNN